MPTDRTVPRRASGFTLIELVVVIGIILVLAGLSLGAAKVVQASQKRSGSRTLVQTVALAIESYRIDSLTPLASSGVTTLRPMWDLDQDFVIDPAPASSAAVQALAPPWYTGFAAMLGAQLPAWAIDSQGFVVDRWQRPLRVDWPMWKTDAQKAAAGVGAARGTGTRLYGASKIGVWSLGPCPC
jgi:prepilin-type N-terminal cleavage/methylation domain-containing protein